MLFKESPDKFWDLISKRYAASPISNRAAYEKKMEKIKTFLSPEHVVLDIGCGTGTQCDDLAGNVKQVTGIDISRKLLMIAEQRRVQRKLDNVQFIQTTVFDERFARESFDVVMAFYVLHFFEDINVVIKRTHDLLKPGGIFISETSCLGEKRIFTRKLLKIAGRTGVLPFINLLTTAQLEQGLAQAGFCLLGKTVFGGPDAEYTLIARKQSL